MLPNYVDDHVGDMHFRARQSRSHRLGCEWMAWCAKTPDLRSLQNFPLQQGNGIPAVGAY